MTEEIYIAEAMGAIADFAIGRGVTSINKLPGCWEAKIDEQWWIAVNAHNVSVECSKGFDVQPFSAYIEYNGFPAGEVSPSGGVIAAGDVANEDTFIAALKAQTPEEMQSF